MVRKNSQSFYDEYCGALSWAEMKLGKLNPSSRSYAYKNILKRGMEDFKNKVKRSFREDNEILILLEASTEANILININKKFSDRTDQDFINSLRKSLSGPILSNQEITGKNDGPRNFQSELLFASKSKYPSTVIFSSGDILYDFGKIKFGIECKRIHSEEKIEKLFDDACVQIENNENIACGYVAMRFDKFYYTATKSGLYLVRPMLCEKKDLFFKCTSEKELNTLFEFQTHSFVEEFKEKFISRVYKKKYKKVAGLCAHIFQTGLLGNPPITYTAAQTTFDFWNDEDPVKFEAHNIMRNMFEFTNG